MNNRGIINNLSIFEQLRIRRIISDNINWVQLYQQSQDLLYYTRVCRVQYTFNPRSIYTNQHIIEEALEAAENICEVLTQIEDLDIVVRGNLQAVVDLHLFVHCYWLEYPYIHPILSWNENSHIIQIYTVQYNGVNTLFLAISDIFKRKTKIIKVSPHRQ